jgi:hypothetical protein
MINFTRHTFTLPNRIDTNKRSAGSGAPKEYANWLNNVLPELPLPAMFATHRRCRRSQSHGS